MQGSEKMPRSKRALGRASDATTRWRRRGRVLLEQGLGIGHVSETEATPAKAKEDRALISQAEIQQDLQRFVALFSERMVQSVEPIAADPSSELFVPALRTTLLALSACLDIAAGPTPEVNLLDMVVFVTLSRDSFAHHYVPNVFGEPGQPMNRVFQTSEEQIWNIARKVLTPVQEKTLRDTIRSWQAAHPEQTRVAGVRFAEFSGLAVDPRHRAQASGILAGVRSATRTADAALLLGERAMFLAPRIPFIIRMHVRLGTRELLTDSLGQLDRVEALMRQAGELRPLLSELTELVGKTSSLALDAQKTSAAAQSLSESAWPLLQGAERLLASPDSPGPQANRVQSLVESSDGLVTRTRALVQDLNEVTHGDPTAAMNAAAARLEHFTKRLLWQVGLVGAGLIALFWLGYYLTRAS